MNKVAEIEITTEGILLNGSRVETSGTGSELLNNALKFASSWAELRIVREEGHSVIIASNDAALPGGSIDQVFDRFTRLSNAEGVPGAGLGLSHVKEIAQAHNGRVSAKAADGAFILRVTL